MERIVNLPNRKTARRCLFSNIWQYTRTCCARK